MARGLEAPPADEEAAESQVAPRVIGHRPAAAKPPAAKRSADERAQISAQGPASLAKPRRVLWCTYTYAAVHGATDQLLPASYKALENELKFTPTILGIASSSSRVAHVVFSPFWGLLVDGCGRSRMFAISAIGWGLCTIGLSRCAVEWQMLMFMAGSGSFMASMGPLTQKVLADALPRAQRGKGFGDMLFCQSLGRMASLLLTGGVARQRSWHMFGGWRVAFVFCGCLSIVVGLLVLAVVPAEAPGPAEHAEDKEERVQRLQQTRRTNPSNDPQAASLLVRTSKGELPTSSSPASHQAWAHPPLPNSQPSNFETPTPDVAPQPLERHKRKSNKFFKFSSKEFAYVLRTKSFWVMLTMGVLNGIPRSALSFSVMWLECCGLSSMQASSAIAASWMTAMFVAPFVGRLGDLTYAWSPNHGRQFLAQASIFLRALFMTILLVVIPKNAQAVTFYFATCIAIGALAGWPGVGVNRPILTEIVLPHHRGFVFSMVSTCEGIGAALLGAPLVGVLSERAFGYVAPGGVAAGEASAVRLGNAWALSYALLCLSVVPWIGNLAAYGVLHCTYKNDRDAIMTAVDAMVEPEDGGPSVLVANGLEDDEGAEEGGEEGPAPRRRCT
eukprot:GHVT01083329.1.p1 GENE.GHVT01083329.1~~GHVT01083329.1.p1  ORF type:complete len:616 (+),score=136.42 GHVT01083329.1:641-2488(+)